jgi:hypothetical protein
MFKAYLKSMIRVLFCYEFAIKLQKILRILHNIAKIFYEFIANFSKQTSRSKILGWLLGVNLFFKWLYIPLLLCSCCNSYLKVQSDYITYKDLASYYVDTPDPRRNCPAVGQRLIVSWGVPQKYLYYENLRLEITIRFRNREEKVEIFHISKNRGVYIFTLLNEDYFSKLGILTYKIDLVADGEILEEWRHKIWVDLIQLKPEETKPKDTEKEASTECEEEEYPIDWNDEKL